MIAKIKEILDILKLKFGKAPVIILEENEWDSIHDKYLNIKE